MRFEWCGSDLPPLQLVPILEELVADAAQFRLIGGAGGVLDADNIETGIVGRAGRIERILADGTAARVAAAQMFQRLEKDGRMALVQNALRFNVKFKVIVKAQPGQDGLALVTPSVRADAHACALGLETGQHLADAGLWQSQKFTNI